MNRRPAQKAFALVLLLSGLALLAASPDGGASPGTSASAAKVELRSNLFLPVDVIVYQGETVEWVNRDPFGHDVTFEDGPASGGPGQLGAGASWSREFPTNGTFRYRCVIHSAGFSSGMVGNVIVRPGLRPEPPPAPSPASGGDLLGVAIAGTGAVVGIACPLLAIACRPGRR